MLRTSSFFGPLNSGFVPFSPAAPVDEIAGADLAEVDTAEAEAAEVVARAAAAPARELARPGVEPWVPASSARIRVVEGAVLLAVCGYFGWALLGTLAGI